MAVPVRQIFISYSRSDEVPVERIARALSKDYPVWFDQAELSGGDPWPDKLDKALQNSSHCLVFLGPGGARPWQKEEVRTAINQAVTGAKRFRLIPVLLPGVRERPGDSELPRFLENRQWVEFRGAVEEEKEKESGAWHRLRCAIEGRPPGFRDTGARGGECPYKGLDVFDVDDAPDFFGRETQTDSILSKLGARISQPGRPRFCAIIGSSGTGKSSLARAGVLAEIKHHRLSEFGEWAWPPLIFKPGDQPLTELAKALIRHIATERRFGLWAVDDLVSKLQGHDHGEYKFLATELDTVLSVGQWFPVLVDQFEEALKPLAAAETDDDKAREKAQAYEREQFVPFLQNLLQASRHEKGRLVVLATMRDDFYGQCGIEQSLKALVSENHTLVGPLSPSELINAVELPARACGKEVEPALLTVIEKDMHNRPGALPLLQEALKQMWETAGETLTVRGYQEVGGIAGALSREADTVFDRLMDEVGDNNEAWTRREETVRQVFLGLAQETGGRYSSRRRERHELPGGRDTSHILKRLVDARLLLESGKQEEQLTHYELTHETLIEHWSKLKNWLQHRDEDDRFLEELKEEADRWVKKRQQYWERSREWKSLEADYLRRGALWKKTKQWLKRKPVDPGELTNRFVERCRYYAFRTNLKKVGIWSGVSIGLLTLVSGIGAWIADRNSAHFVLSRVEDEKGRPIKDYRVLVSEDGKRWARRFVWVQARFLAPNKTYWVAVSGNDYLNWLERITPSKAGETIERKVTLHASGRFTGPNMETIPAGRYKMGDVQETGSPDERPMHPVQIAKAFKMGRYEVTFEEYDLFAKAVGRVFPRDEGWGRGRRPVINVSWEHASEYTVWLSLQTGKRYRLPTEAEWEYAARAGTQWNYWWGNKKEPRKAVCVGCESDWKGKAEGSETARVDDPNFKPNNFGLYHTAGNVFEWVQDCWHDNYKGDSPKDGSAWLDSDRGDCGRRVIRGGSWNDGPGYLRSAFRDRGDPGYRYSYLGFRLAQD